MLNSIDNTALVCCREVVCFSDPRGSVIGGSTVAVSHDALHVQRCNYAIMIMAQVKSGNGIVVTGRHHAQITVM